MADVNPAAVSAFAPRASRTAVITCVMRSLHTRYDRPALIHDDWADRLVTPEEKRELAAAVLHIAPFVQAHEDSPAAGAAPPIPDPAAADRERMLNAGPPELILHTAWRGTGVYGGVIIRTRYTEDRLADAVARGVRQYVLIGAGLDSFALRRPDFAKDLAIFEVDHPASHENKKKRIADAGIAVPAGPLHFVSADLSRESLPHAVARSGFQMDQPAVFSWLGVTMYLTREANLATLRAVGQFAPGSELVFTYLEERIFNSDSPAMARARAGAAALGEPWLSGFDSATLPTELLALNLRMEEDLGHRELTTRFCAAHSDSLTPGRAGRIAAAVVG